MANTFDLYASLYDALAQAVRPGSDSVLQFQWPGYALSPADFKPVASPAGAYDPMVAEETTSQLGDMLPASTGATFEDSGYELHDVYEALIFGAMPKDAGAEGNPLGGRFLDAQFEYVRAEKGSTQDPQVFYYPALATPRDWYTETCPGWSTFQFGAAEVTPATPSRPFVRLGGERAVRQGVLRLAPVSADAGLVRTRVESALKDRTVHVAPPRVPVGVSAARVQPQLARPQSLAAVGAARRDPAQLRAALANWNAHPEKKAELRPRPALTGQTVPASIDAKQMVVAPSTRMPVGRRLQWNRLITLGLTPAPVATTTEGWRIQFRYAVVRLNRNWLNSTLLAMPNWYVPGLPAGYFSQGAGGASAQFAGLPLAFVAVRNLRISANWSAQDQASMRQALSFGPFDMRGQTWVQGEVRVEGLQVIAWVTKANPVLPPEGDPGM